MTSSELALHTCCNHNNKTYIFGGYSNYAYQNTVWEFDNEKRKWTKVVTQGNEKPPERISHTSIVYEGKMFIFGGYSDTLRCSDVFQLDLKTKEWTKVSTEHPFGNNDIYYHSSCLYLDSMIVFGGINSNQPSNNLYSFNFKNFKWTKLLNKSTLTTPTPRFKHQSLIYKDNLYIIGGQDFSRQFKDVYSYNFKTEKWKIIITNGVQQPNYFLTSPVLRKESAFLFGNDTKLYELNLPKGTWSSVDRYIEREDFSLSLKKDEIIVLGGFEKGSKKYCREITSVLLPPETLNQSLSLLYHQVFTDVEIIPQDGRNL